MPKEKKLFNSDSEEEEEKEYKPSKKQVESSEEEFSDDDEDEKPISVKKQKAVAATGDGKKRKRVDVERDDKGDQIFELSTKRRITVRAFSSGEPAIDIREVYLDKDKQVRPGKGICLPIAQWKKLKEFLPDIEDAISALPDKKK